MVAPKIPTPSPNRRYPPQADVSQGEVIANYSTVDEQYSDKYSDRDEPEIAHLVSRGLTRGEAILTIYRYGKSENTVTTALLDAPVGTFSPPPPPPPLYHLTPPSSATKIVEVESVVTCSTTTECSTGDAFDEAGNPVRELVPIKDGRNGSVDMYRLTVPGSSRHGLGPMIEVEGNQSQKSDLVGQGQSNANVNVNDKMGSEWDGGTEREEEKRRERDRQRGREREEEKLIQEKENVEDRTQTDRAYDLQQQANRLHAERLSAEKTYTDKLFEERRLTERLQEVNRIQSRRLSSGNRLTNGSGSPSPSKAMSPPLMPKTPEQIAGSIIRSPVFIPVHHTRMTATPGMRKKPEHVPTPDRLANHSPYQQKRGSSPSKVNAANVANVHHHLSDSPPIDRDHGTLMARSSRSNDDNESVYEEGEKPDTAEPSIYIRLVNTKGFKALNVSDELKSTINYASYMSPNTFVTLKSLVLRNNELEDMSKLTIGTNFPNLVELDLGYNFLSSKVLGNYLPQTMIRMDLSYNRLTHVDGIIVCSQLEELNLSNNCIKSLPLLPASLRRLDLSSNRIKKFLNLRLLSFSPALEYLNLEHNAVVTHDPKCYLKLRAFLPKMCQMNKSKLIIHQGRKTEDRFKEDEPGKKKKSQYVALTGD